MIRKNNYLIPLFLVFTLLLPACGGKEAAATMHLVRTEGAVSVNDTDGAPVTLMENLGLYSGYGVATQAESYGWIDLDEAKLAKMDEDSEVEIVKSDKLLEIRVQSGGLFFNVTEPLAEDETMNIRTSTMLVGIRGTCGWVEVPDSDTMRVFLLEGRVRCEVDGERETVRAGKMAVMTEDGEITVEEFSAADVPAFVLEELEDDGDLMEAILDDSGIDVLNPVTPEQTALEQYRAVLAQAETYFDEDEYYGDDVPTITYAYALVQMQTEHQIPALVLEKESESYWWGDICSAVVFQYNPDSDTVIQAEGTLSEGVASAGGYRGTLALSGDGTGVLETSWSSGTGMGTISRVTLAGNALQWDTVFDGFLFDDSQPNVASLPITWYNVSDLSGLDSWTPGAPVQPDQPGSEPGPAEPDVPPTDGDRLVLQGTVNTYSGAELLGIQGQQDPNPGPWSESGNTFRVIMLDPAQSVTARSGDGQGSYSGETMMIDVTYAQGLEQYDGQHVTFSIDPNNTWWPSDTSLPLGQPRTDDVHILQ